MPDPLIEAVLRDIAIEVREDSIHAISHHAAGHFGADHPIALALAVAKNDAERIAIAAGFIRSVEVAITSALQFVERQLGSGEMRVVLTSEARLLEIDGSVPLLSLYEAACESMSLSGPATILQSPPAAGPKRT